MSHKPTLTGDQIVASLENLRNELMPKAFDLQGRMLNTTYAEMVWKINSCLYVGYPSRAAVTGKAPAFEAPHNIDPVVSVTRTIDDDRGMTCKTL